MLQECIEAWHGIGREERLAEGDIKYFTELLMYYIEMRLGA